MVAFVIDENLRLVGQPAKGGRMNDAVAVALKRRSDRMLRLRIKAPASLLRLRRIRRERSDHRQTLRPTGRSVHPGGAKPPEMAAPHRFALVLRPTHEAGRFGLTTARSGRHV